ncbi:MAG: N-acetylmuramoyl-L-alanine amidase [Candidatus Shapirobacteria bacterium]
MRQLFWFFLFLMDISTAPKQFPPLPRVGIQVGHWKNNELPEELSKHIANTGSSGGGWSEAEVNLLIAKNVARILEEKGVKVDLLPATIPPSYRANVFLAIHADGNLNPSVRGFKIADPQQDLTRNASLLINKISESYVKTTSLPLDKNITANMRDYYAFAWWKYKHALHPLTPAAIIETGFLTNPQDRYLLTSRPEIPAQGIAQGIINYLESENLLTTTAIDFKI